MTKKLLLLFIAGFFVLVHCSSSLAVDNQKLHIWITIDTESTHYVSISDEVNTEIGGVGCGIAEMMNICDKYGVKATFFTNMCEEKTYGKEKIKAIVQYIHNRGHEVQLHPHPDWGYDKKRTALWQYSSNGQDKIISDGRDLIHEWTGIYPIAFRAGGYMADNNTLKVLQANNFVIDSTFFYKFPLCRVSDPSLAINAVRKISGIWEVPVTLFRRLETPKHNWLHLKPVIRYRKIDIDWASYDDLKSSLLQIKKDKHLKIIVLFLHSFSFLSDNGKAADIVDIRKFDKILSFISNDPGMKVITCNEIEDIVHSPDFNGMNKDFVPEVHAYISYPKYFVRRYSLNKKTVLIIFGVLMIAFMVMLLLVYRRRKNKC
ncbi:MAG: polysaccharide deacetylase family protein [Clostridiales bacterium]|nr:polysaccharide deacetylase family protein [Clostridiales bacterium]